MSYLSGARAIGYIEKYAPEGMRDPEHFMPMLRPHGPSGKVGISALDGENWAVFSQSKYPNEAFEFLRLFYKKEHYLQYCHSVPIHLSRSSPRCSTTRPTWPTSGSRSGRPGTR
jgi:ABC-type glycerol-3-phosphate transport system substrate-binding protein